MALILDTGPLFASIDRKDPAHAACRRLLENTDEALVIPAPVLFEMDYWIRKELHVGPLLTLLEQVTEGAFLVEDLTPADYLRVRDLCDRYSDSDLGLVDAAVLAVVSV